MLPMITGSSFYRNINRFVTGLIFLVLGLNISFAREQNKPNVLFIAVDDLKPDLGCFGDSLAITPNIDALAKKGMVFTKAYCQQAVCAPSRASLLTGRYPDQTQVWDLKTLIRDKNPDILTLPQYFKQNGYSTEGTGKIFDPRSVDKDSDKPSWNKYEKEWVSKWYNVATGKPSYFYASPEAKDTIAILEAEAVKKGVDKKTYVQDHYWPSVEKADVPYDAYVDGAIANIGISLMNELNAAGKPFFLAVGFHRPHLPFNAPKEFWDLHDRNKFSLASFRDKSLNSPSIAYHNYEELRSYTDIPDNGNVPDEKQLELIHAYYAATSYIDFLIGKLTTRLEELGLADNTIIVLWGDHGWHLGDHNLWCKHSNFEQATHAPLIISYPGQPGKGELYNSPVEFTDIATTLCQLSGMKVPVDFEGVSLVPAMENPQTRVRIGALSQYPRNQYMGYTLRTNRYRYTRWVNKNDGSYYASELYDYETDPLETVSLVFNADYDSIRNELDSIVQARIKIPSTQKKIEFRTLEIKSGTDTIPVKNASVQFEERQLLTDENGKVLFTHVTGNYHYSVNSKGFEDIDGQLTLNDDTIVSLYLKNELYDVQIKITGEWNHQEIENAFVTLGERQKSSDANGDVFFNDVSYNNYIISVRLENGWTQEFENVEIFSDTSLVLNVTEPTFLAQIQVFNKYTMRSIYQSNITVGNYSLLTDSEGLATFSVPEGKYPVKIEHDKYAAVEDSISVYSDTIFSYLLLPAFSTIKFKMYENTTPVNDAIVTIAGEEQVSNNLGSAFFRNYPAFAGYSFKIEKESYKTIEGNLFLINDTTIEIQMEAISTASINSPVEKLLKIWPNPVKSMLNFQVPEKYNSGYADIVDMRGKTIKTIILKNRNRYNVDLKNLSGGTYLLKIRSSTKPVTGIFFKK